MSTRGPRTAYVVGGYLPNGGTYMGYHVGRILAKEFGFSCRIVTVGQEAPETGVFDYPDLFESVDLPSMERCIASRDLLIASPSFSDRLFGLRLPATKLMYVQGFNTFSVIDGWFDHYVSVSSFTRHFLRQVYDIPSPVIPPFIELDAFPEQANWQARRAGSVLVGGKLYFSELLNEFQRVMTLRHPGLDYALTVPARQPRRQFLELMTEHRYFVTLSPCEGFGLVPLEAMACGCTVLGFHGRGGLEYMRPGLNCQTVSYPRMDLLTDALASAVRRPAGAEALAQGAAATALEYGYAAFKGRWISFLESQVVPGTSRQHATGGM